VGGASRSLPSLLDLQHQDHRNSSHQILLMPQKEGLGTSRDRPHELSIILAELQHLSEALNA
jgi:hypothetical protein